MTVQTMMLHVIRKFGFEDKHTIEFCMIAETQGKSAEVRERYNKLMGE